MRLDSIFSNKNTNVFSKKGIKIPYNFEFSNINIIIGPNGGGKTRFLSTIKELYEKELRKKQDVKIIYSYFPSLSSYKAPPKSKIPDYSLVEYYLDENVTDFSDFFKEIESQCNKFFNDLLNYRSKKDRARNKELFNTIKDIFIEFTQKELIEQQNEFYVKTSENELNLLLDELKHMSPGERVLLYMSIFITLQKKSTKKKIIILDEPECHLHPKALLSFIDYLKKILDDDVECWIATHSLFLIPEFEFENIVYIKDGQIQKRTSQLYHKIFSEMLGDEDGKVKTFFSSLPYWHYFDFIHKCFTTPDVIETINPEDEQVRLFRKYLHGIKKNTFRVLDWGGGNGRLGSSLEAASSEKEIGFCYEIYDPNPKYKGDKFKVHTDLEDITSTYDCIVMMNVLHEINPTEWCEMFSNIYRFLKEDAYLFFIEVKALSQGELPNEDGYFVLGKPELEILFQNKDLIEFILENEDGKEQKSSCFAISRESLRNVSENTIQKAMQNLKDRMFAEINVYYDSNKTDKPIINKENSRKYAFLLQQYFVATRFIEQYREEASQSPELQAKLTKVIANYAKVRCYGGQYVRWPGTTPLSDELYEIIKNSARSFSTLDYNSKEYLFINLCEEETSRDNMAIVFDSLESETEFSVDISDAYLERVYSLHKYNTESYLDEKMKLNVHMHNKGNTISVPIAYACHHNNSTSVLLNSVLTDSNAQYKEINLIESPSEAGKIIGFSETAYCIKCITSMGKEFYITLYMANKDNYFEHKLSIGDDDYKKYYEAAKRDIEKAKNAETEIEITQKYNSDYKAELAEKDAEIQRLKAEIQSLKRALLL